MTAVRRRERRARRAGTALLLLAAVFAPFLAYVWSHLQIVGTGYRIEATETRLGELDQENRRLRLLRSRLMSLRAIEDRARALGLGRVPPGRVLVVAAPGAPAPHPPELAKASRPPEAVAGP
jgi:hypothetical protein